MALNQVGSALGYEELLSNAQRSIGEKVLGSDKLQKASDILGQITTTHLLLGQFGFYKAITNKVKELGAEYEATLKSKLAGLANLNNDMGTELKTIETPVAPLNEGYNAEEGVFGKTIVGDAPEPQVDSETTDEGRIAPSEPVSDRPPINDIFAPEPITPFGYRPPYDPDRLFQDVAGLPDVEFESRAPLFFTQRAGEAAQGRRALARGEVPPPPSEAPPVQRPQADEPVNRPLEASTEEINNERTSDLPVPETNQPADIPPSNPFEGQLVRPSTELEVTAGLAGEARTNLAVPVEEGKSAFLRGFSNIYNKAQDIQSSVESGIQRFNRLRNQATSAFDNIKAAGQSTLEKGQSLLQAGKEAIANGDLTGQDLVDRGNAFINQGIEQAKNSDLARATFNKAQDYIERGNTLLSQGKSEGQDLLNQGNDLLKATQTQIEGYGTEAANLSKTLDAEVAQRTSQLADLASAGGSAVFGALSGVGVAGAFKSGNRPQEGLQTSQLTTDVVKAGAEAGGEAGGEVLGEGLAAAIPVVGEVIDAGLLLTQLFTGIASAFKPHDAVTSIVSATSQYGV